jgi:hypothetical protein
LAVKMAVIIIRPDRVASGLWLGWGHTSLGDSEDVLFAFHFTGAHISAA